MPSQEMLKTNMSGPIPGQSLTTPPKNALYEQPPQYGSLEEAMNYLMNQLLDAQYLKQLLGMMNAGMSIEAIARVIIFTGFSMGKWTPDLGIVMYKPLMFTLITIAKAAGMTSTPVVMKENLDKFMTNRFAQNEAFSKAKMEGFA